MDFTPGVDTLGFADNVAIDDIIFRFNGTYTEVIDTRGLGADIIKILEGVAKVPLGQLLNNGGVFDREVGALYSADGAGRS